MFVRLMKIMTSSCILVETPLHGNLGDHAICLEEEKIFDECNIKCEEILTQEFIKYRKYLAKLICKKQCIMFNGGGSLGSIWPADEMRFRNLLRLFPDNRVIVLPQTITFDMKSETGRKFFEESRQIYSDHKYLTVFLRERTSYEFIRNFMPDVKCFLVPDMVLNYRPQIALTSWETRRGILFCMRADVEKVLRDSDIKKLEQIISEKYPDEVIEHTDMHVKHSVPVKDRENEVKKKLVQLSEHKLVVTDRLHGMIFAAITNTPCIAFNNLNGKVVNVYQWIKGCEYIRFAENTEDFIKILGELNLERNYHYDYSLVEDYFEPLISEIKKTII